MWIEIAISINYIFLSFRLSLSKINVTKKYIFPSKWRIFEIRDSAKLTKGSAEPIRLDSTEGSGVH